MEAQQEEEFWRLILKIHKNEDIFLILTFEYD